MFIIRNANSADLFDIHELSLLLNFINLPSDPLELEKRLINASRSFDSPSPILENNYYIFVLEDLLKKKVIGVSLIHGKHGTERSPHFYLSVRQDEKFSHTLNKAVIHPYLKFGYESQGYSEIGGLILHPKYRGDKFKVGRPLSFVRFLYMSLFPERFTKIVHTELMPPLDSQGNSLLWEAIGRKFFEMEYSEADKLSRKNKEFIISLFPSGPIYISLLPKEAQEVIGKVGEQTVPVQVMLEKIGFRYVKEVDPFDGGPHYRAELSQLTPIKNKSLVSFDQIKFLDSSAVFRDFHVVFSPVLVGGIGEDGQFMAFLGNKNQATQEILVHSLVEQRFEINKLQQLHCIPLK